MKLGVVFPQTEIGTDPAVIRDYAQAVEETGFEQLLAYDHVLGAPRRFRRSHGRAPTSPSRRLPRAVRAVRLSRGVTRRVELVTGILILPQRQTALVAKQAAAVDVLSGGRLRLGIGLGWNLVEYEALGEDFHNRGRASRGAGRRDAPSSGPSRW